MGKRVLIVDDDEAILRLLEYSLKKLGSEYEIHTARNSLEALEQIEKETFDVVVADYLMPELTGVDLARAVRSISPKTQVVLMTAYGTQGLRDTTEFLGFDAYLDKPFSLDEIRKVVEHAVTLTGQTKTGRRVSVAMMRHAIRQHLTTLSTNANARCVMLLNVNGQPIEVVGQVNEQEVASMGRFVAANFLASKELAKRLGSSSVFKSSYHEGDNYNIYAYDVDKKFLLAVMFDPKLKPGVVWFYTKQMAAILAKSFDQTD
jgi:CheY-like chemotaxis protein/predicted regulator of Ras-like GTPase activity (Roadblock/LC7/MglB family)